MQLQRGQLFGAVGDDRAATPVVGIVLMVAVAVILAGLISPELLSLSRESGEAGPSAVVEFEFRASAADAPDSWGNDRSSVGAGGGLLTVTHASGEGIPVGRLTLRGASSGDDLSFTAASGTATSDGEFDTGDELTVWVSGDDTVRVVWDSREGTKTTAVAVWSDG